MSEIDQVPFEGVEFADNPEPRCPCILLLDTSGSMSGAKIAQLNSGLQTFAEELRSDTMAAKRVEVAIISFGPVQILQEFVTVDAFQAPVLIAGGDTPMGAAIVRALTLLGERKAAYKANGSPKRASRAQGARLKLQLAWRQIEPHTVRSKYDFAFEYVAHASQEGLLDLRAVRRRNHVCKHERLHLR